VPPGPRDEGGRGGRRTCLVDEYLAETRRATCTNGAQTSPVAGAEQKRGHASGELPGECRTRSALERSDRVVPGLHEIREVAALGAQRPSTHRGGHRQSAKQMLR
jgi:hypothetical protein